MANHPFARAGGPSGLWGSGKGLLLMALALFLLVIILWLFIDQREGSMYPVPRANLPDLREIPR